MFLNLCWSGNYIEFNWIPDLFMLSLHLLKHKFHAVIHFSFEENFLKFCVFR